MVLTIAAGVAPYLAATAQSASSAQDLSSESVTVTLTGDSILTRRLSVYQEPAFTGVMELVRLADVAFTNLERLFHDFESWPAHESGGT